jgi:hypothetical protein
LKIIQKAVKETTRTSPDFWSKKKLQNLKLKMAAKFKMGEKLSMTFTNKISLTAILDFPPICFIEKILAGVQLNNFLLISVANRYHFYHEIRKRQDSFQKKMPEILQFLIFFIGNSIGFTKVY